MALILLLNQNDIPSLTSFDGNIDADKLKPYIYLSQKNNIKRILSLELYNKILADFTSDSLVDVYKTIYEEHVIDMLVFFSASKYMAFGGVKVSNNGVHKIAFAGATLLSEKETAKQISIYEQLAKNAEESFIEFMNDPDTPDIPEYKSDANEKNKNKLIPWF